MTKQRLKHIIVLYHINKVIKLNTLFLFHICKEEEQEMDAGPDSTRRCKKKLNMDCIKQEYDIMGL